MENHTTLPTAAINASREDSDHVQDRISLAESTLESDKVDAGVRSQRHA